MTDLRKALRHPIHFLHKSLLGRILVVCFFVGIFMLFTQSVAYLDTPRVHYNIKRLDCSEAAISERDKAIGSQQDACIIIIEATNLKSKAEYIDWDGVGGGPLADWHPMIQIHARNGKFCYAAVDLHEKLSPDEAQDLTLQCFGNEVSLPNYDIHSDTQPLYIEIKNRPTAKLYF